MAAQSSPRLLAWVSWVRRPYNENVYADRDPSKKIRKLPGHKAEGKSEVTANPAGSVRTPLPTIALIRLKVAAETEEEFVCLFAICEPFSAPSDPELAVASC